MRFSETIVVHGTQAVRAYREISGITHDNRLPEIFIGSWIARGLHDDLGVKARVECYFTEMARDLGQAVDMDLVSTMGGWRADVAIYENDEPTTVVEIKIHDEGRHEGLVHRDLNKMRKLAERTGIKTYLGVLITDTSRKTCTARAEALGRSLGKPFDVLGEPVRAGGGDADWSWLFACGDFS